VTGPRGSDPGPASSLVISGSQVAVGDRNVVGDGNVVVDRFVFEGWAHVSEPTTRDEAAGMLLCPPPRPASDALPGGWLRPEAGVITPWRRPEAEDLVQWCVGKPTGLLRLVHGLGGQGKTQLAGQVCAELRQRGWLAGFVELPAPGGGEVPAVGRGAGLPISAWSHRQSEIMTAVRALPKLGVSALLVVDYAENHAAAVGMLLREAVRAATAPTASTPPRILLLSRGEVDWLDDHPCRGWVHPEPILLGPLPGSLWEAGGEFAELDAAEVVAQVWTKAVTQFAAHVESGPLTTTAEPGALAAAALATGTPTSFLTTLDLYADALLRVLDRAQQLAGPAEAGASRPGGDPISGILAHERRVVAQAFAAAGVDLDGYERDRAVCVAFLRPAADSTSAADALATLPGLRALPAGQRDRVVGVLARLFPSDGGENVWEAPRPDRLTDTHLLRVAQAARSGKDFDDYVVAVCGGDDRQLAGHTARTLLRALSTPGAAVWYPVGLRRVEGSITALARAHPGGYVPALVALDPVRFEDEILDTLDVRRTAAGSQPLPIEPVEDIDSELRRIGATTSRLRIAVAVSRRLVEATRPAGTAEDDPVEVARHADQLVGLSRRLAEAGSLGEAVGPAREAVKWYRPLFDGDPETYRQALAAAVTNLGSRLADDGAPAAALAAAEEAVTLRRELAETGSHEHQVDLASALHNLGLRLWDAEEVDRAVAPAGEAVTLLRALAAADPAEQARLAVVLTSLAQIHAATGSPVQAVAAAREAVAIMRRLAEANPDGYLPGLAAALVALSAHLSPPAGRPRMSRPVREAVRLAAEAVETCRQLAVVNPLAYEPDLAAALTNLGLRYATAGQATEAVTATEQAVDIRRRLAGHDSNRHRADLAASLSNVALQVGSTRRRADALAPAREAVEVYGQLQEELPSARSDLAAALTNLGYLLAATGRDDEAIAPTAQAVATYQQLLADQPQLVQRIYLAEAQYNLGLHYTHTRHPQDAVEALTAAVDGYRQIAETHPHAVHAGLRAATAALDHAQAPGTGATAHPDRARTQVRYARRWHEEAIRYPLPGIIIVLGWRTDLAARQPRQRTVRDDLVALVFDRKRAATAAEATSTEEAATGVPAAPASAATGALSGIANRVSQLTGTLTARVASSRLLSPLVANSNITQLGKVVGLATALTALVAGVIVVAPGHHPAPAPSTDVAQSTPNPTFPPGPGQTGGPLVPGSTSSNGSTSGTGSTSSNGPGVTSSNGAGSSPSSGSSVSNPDIINTPCGQNQHAVAVPHDPSPATMSLSNPNVVSPSNHGVSTWAMSRVARMEAVSLTAPTFAIRIDATRLVYRRFFIPGVTSHVWVDSRLVQTLQLAPGSYPFQFASGYFADFRFTVTQAGKIDYDSRFNSFLSGTGTSTLTISGFLVTLDARHLSGLGVLLAHMPAQGWITYTQVRMVPASHYDVQSPGGIASFSFKLGLDGRFSYGSSLDVRSGGVLKGNGTSSLEIVGYPIRIDASRLSYRYFLIPNITLKFIDAQTIPTLQVLPGSYAFQFASGYFADFRFTVTQAGLIDYDSRFAGFLSAYRSTLTVTGLSVTLDARRLSGLGILLAHMPAQGWITYEQVRMLPASHYSVQQGSGEVTSFIFKLGLDGRFSYDSSLDANSGGFLKGNGTSTLEFLGYPLCVDARSAGGAGVTVEPIRGMPFSTTHVQLAYLLPAPYFRLRFNPGHAPFSLAPNGTFSFDSALSPYLRLEKRGGITVLTVLAPPPA